MSRGRYSSSTIVLLTIAGPYASPTPERPSSVVISTSSAWRTVCQPLADPNTSAAGSSWRNTWLWTSRIFMCRLRLRACSRERLHDHVGGPALEEVLDVQDGAEQAVPDHLGGLPGAVGREDDVRQREDGIAGLERLVVEDVEARRRDAPRLEGLEQRGAFHEGAAPGVDEDRGRFHRGQLLRREKATCLRREAEVEGYDVRGGQDRVLRARIVRPRAPREDRHADATAERGHAA